MRKRNIVIVLVALALVAGLYHAYCVYLDSASTPAPEAEQSAPAEP